MENWTPIDDLFREKLQQGKEQINLGAWANMERMLDGKNPYASDQEKKKKRILPFLGLFLLLSSLFTAGYYAVDKLQPDNQPQKIAENSANTSSNSKTDTQHEPQLQNETNKNDAPIQTSSTTNTFQPILKKESKLHTNSLSSSDDQSSKNTSKVAPDNISNSTTTSKQNNSNTQNLQTKSKTSTNQSSATTLTGNGDEESLLNEIESNKTNSNQQKSLLTINTVAQKATTKPQPTFDTIPQVEIKEKISRNRSGSIKEIEFDTIAITSHLKEKPEVSENNQPNELMANDSLQKNTSVKNEKNNPRYVKLNAAEEEQIRLNANLPIEESKTAIITQQANPSIQNKSTVQLEQVNHKSKETSYFQDMMSAAKTNYEKLNGKLDIRRLSLYPGISVGINAALFNTTHNYGGFHFGVNNLIPVNNYFSVLSELKLFYRNNSGFTVNDINSTTLNKNVDNTTLASQNKNIYSYQIDSNVKKYNFKSFTSLELPLMLQFNYKKITAYGGINFAYNFKLKANEINLNYHPERFDTVGMNTPYFYPADKSFQYAKDDFGSRFGIGYTIGTSFSFNPNLYVDLRLTQNTWDNTKTNSAREVSNGFFKVPFVQFSIGYRFKKYTPDN